MAEPCAMMGESSRREKTRARKVSRGGYDCEFVTEPPDAFQTECPVCLQIPRGPCVISCPCGKEFCRDCIERIKSADKPCPMCNKTEFTFLRHHGSERYLKAQEVWCSHKRNGCGWRGRLGEFEDHLNEDPSPDKQLDGCRFVEVECVHGCGGRFQRSEVASHQNEECQERPYSCEYCREYDSTFEDVTEIHHPQCRKYPVVCPNKCREAPFERQEVESHVKDKCPLTEVECPLHYAGCEVKLPRKDMPDHMKDTATHLTLLANVTKSLLRENQEQQQSFDHLKEENQELKQSIEDYQKATEKEVEVLKEETQRQSEEQQKSMEHLKTGNEKLKQQNQELEDKQKATENEVKTLKEETNQLKMTLGQFPVDFRVNYSNKEEVYLPPFYTHSCGYRMCVRFDPNGNKDGKGTHVSIYTYLMRGSYDNQLKWPFRGDITIQIVNQAGDHSHVENTIPYDDKTPDRCAGRVTVKERAENGLGKHQFLAHTDHQYYAAKGTQYMKDDIIIVRVVGVKITQ